MTRRAPPETTGRPGVRIVGGRVVGIEANPDLTDERWPTVATRMLREDDAAQAAAEAVISTLMSARLSVSPGDPASGFSRKLADDCAAMLGTGSEPGMMARPLDEIVSEQVLHELIGVRYAEPRWGYRPGFGVILEDLEDRDGTAHRKWLVEGGRLVGVEQAALPDDGFRLASTRVTIPADQLVVVVRGKTGQNWGGRGLLRGAYAAWMRKRHYEDMAGIAAERWAVGVPELHHNAREAEEAGIPADEHRANVETARAALADFVAQEETWVETAPGIEIRRIGGDIDPSAILALINHEKTAILTAMLLGFLQLGQTETGSRAVGTVLETFFRRAGDQALARITAAWNGAARPGGGVLHRWAEYNHGPVDPRLLPKLSHSGLIPHPLVQLAERLDLGAVLRVDEDRVLRNTLRAQLALDPEPVAAPPVDAPAPGVTATPEPPDA
ncbi:MAG: hypothetical protein EKK55_24280 [Rhodocyclaceae bacterium]|nr:MAG: hypothetical protein EKK55_24280 [Rhodocyclaceae bacterium]